MYITTVIATYPLKTDTPSTKNGYYGIISEVIGKVSTQ